MGDSEYWLSSFVEWLIAGGVSAGTVKIRSSYIRRYIDHVGDPATATPGDVAAFLARDDWSPETKKSALASLRVFYDFANRSGALDVDPTQTARAIRVPRALPRPAPADNIAKALANADEPERLAIMLGLYCGLRAGEVIGLHSDDVADGWLRIKGKGGVERRVPVMHADLAAALEVATRRGGWVFPSPIDPTRHVCADFTSRRCAALLGDGVTFHQLRHAYGTAVYAASKDVRAVQRLLGHANISTTERYVDVADEALRAAVGAWAAA